MATTANNTSLILSITGAPGVALKRGEKTTLPAKAGQRYRVVKEGEEEAAKDVAASQQGQDLLLTYADGTQVVLVNFYEACKAEQCAVDMPGSKGTGANGGYVIAGDSPTGASMSDGGRLVYAFGETSLLAGMTQGAEQARGFTLQDSWSTYIPAHDTHSAWSPMLALVGVGGAAALLLQGNKAVPVPTVIHGSVVAGPVVAGNGLTAVAYKSDGTVLATTVTANHPTDGNAGYYLFKDLTPGDYKVQFFKPTGYDFTKKDIGADGSDSDVNDASGGMTIVTTLVSVLRAATAQSSLWRLPDGRLRAQRHRPHVRRRG